MFELARRTGGDFATALRLALEGKAREENAMAPDCGEIALFPRNGSGIRPAPI